jgi:hypothetical protein
VADGCESAYEALHYGDWRKIVVGRVKQNCWHVAEVEQMLRVAEKCSFPGAGYAHDRYVSPLAGRQHVSKPGCASFYGCE